MCFSVCTPSFPSLSLPVVGEPHKAAGADPEHHPGQVSQAGQAVAADSPSVNAKWVSAPGEMALRAVLCAQGSAGSAVFWIFATNAARKS